MGRSTTGLVYQLLEFGPNDRFGFRVPNSFLTLFSVIGIESIRYRFLDDNEANSGTARSRSHNQRALVSNEPKYDRE